MRVSDGPGGPALVHLLEVPCSAIDCSSTAALPESPRVDEPTEIQPATSAEFSFRQSSDSGAPVIGYELRYVIPSSSFTSSSTVKPTPYATPSSSFTLDESTFARWTPAPAPAVAAPGTVTAVTLDGLLPQTEYAVGVRARGTCGWSNPSFIRIHTGQMQYTKLSGCVIATAAYGSELDPDVALLRRERDWAAQRSDLVTLAALLYARSAPPLAALLSRSDPARAAIRALLRPAMAANRALAGVRAHVNATAPARCPTATGRSRARDAR